MTLPRANYCVQKENEKTKSIQIFAKPILSDDNEINQLREKKNIYIQNLKQKQNIWWKNKIKTKTSTTNQECDYVLTITAEASKCGWYS